MNVTLKQITDPRKYASYVFPVALIKLATTLPQRKEPDMDRLQKGVFVPPLQTYTHVCVYTCVCVIHMHTRVYIRAITSIEAEKATASSAT